MNPLDYLQNAWSFVDTLPTPPITPASYIAISIVVLVVGSMALRGNPTKGA